ncbi:MAG: hypothetical protein K6U80_10800 [Firmicutes bacterium]|nr:hypothetical protein [Bacillota bacterium]
MKRICIGLLILAFLLSYPAATVWAAEGTAPERQGSLDVGLGTENTLGFGYQLGDKWDINAEYQTGNIQPDFVKAGIHYQLFTTMGVTMGFRYEPAAQVSFPYSVIDFAFPFGMNLAMTGLYDANSNGLDWTRYEAALRIQMYEGVYLFSGVRGDIGAVSYLPEEEQRPVLFLKVKGDWQWGKFGLSIQPYLYVEGTLLHDYTFKYQMNDRVSMIVNYKDTFDGVPRYQAGIWWRF